MNDYEGTIYKIGSVPPFGGGSAPRVSGLPCADPWTYIVSMRRTIAVSIALFSLHADATQVVLPPLTVETLRGTWEGLWSPGSPPNPTVFYHMEINKDGNSFLAETSVGTRACLVRRLISSEVTDGKVKLRFASTSAADMPGVIFPEVWIVGKGGGTEDDGMIEATLRHNAGVEDQIYFVKGTWTRDLGEASKKAEEEIKKAAASKP